MKENDRKIFLVASASKTRREILDKLIEMHVSTPTIYMAPDGGEALAKLKNVPPHVLVTDGQLPKVDGYRLVEALLQDKVYDQTAAIFLDPPQSEAIFVDELVTGRVQFYMSEFDKGFDGMALTHMLFRAMNYVAHSKSAEYYMRFLAEGDVLMKEGEQADFVYFVRKGTLKAMTFQGETPVALGLIGPGECVGEICS